MTRVQLVSHSELCLNHGRKGGAGSAAVSFIKKMNKTNIIPHEGPYSKMKILPEIYEMILSSLQKKNISKGERTFNRHSLILCICAPFASNGGYCIQERFFFAPPPPPPPSSNLNSISKSNLLLQ